jgi:hypothetical protein
MDILQTGAGSGDTALESDAAPNDAEEAQLILAAKAGDHRAFEDLLATYESRIYRCGLRMMGDAGAAADSSQEVALKMDRHPVQFEGKARLATFDTHNRHGGRPKWPLPRNFVSMLISTIC